MTQPSKAGAMVLFLFGLPFFAFGAFATFAFFTSAPSVHNNSNPIAGAIFASVFAMIGAGLMFGAVYGYWAQKRDAAAKEANPQSPGCGAATGRRAAPSAVVATPCMAGGSAPPWPACFLFQWR